VRYISHELRTPLNTAFLGLKLLSSDLKASNDPKDIERYDTLCDVNMSCTAAVDILNDLLCYEKLECGIMELRRENIVVELFLKNCILMFSAQARECGVTISTVTDAADRDIEATPDGYDVKMLSKSLLPTDRIFADKFKMDQVIRNLMSNALKFTPRGGVVTIKATFVPNTAPEIQDPQLSRSPWQDVEGGESHDMKNPGYTSRLSVSKFSTGLEGREEGKLVVVVTDTGAGISKENQARLFNEIVQFNPEKLQAGGGSGLGLWITQEILNLHDGSISVSSEGEGKGSSFTMVIPMVRQPADATCVPPAPPSTPSHSPASYESYGKSSNSELENFAVCDDITDTMLGSQKSGWSREIIPQREMEKDGPYPPYNGSRSISRDVLVVDDSRLNRKMLLKCLRADGHTCFEAEDGLEAVAIVKERIGHATGGNGKPFDAVLMDFVMPNMDGPTATKEIRALGYTSPIFGVTGNGEWLLKRIYYCLRLSPPLPF
jgi:signal transduction histidine kinase